MPDELIDQITGTIEHIVFTSEDTGFTVAHLQEPKKKDTTIIVGSLPSVQLGESIFCKGTWKYHPKHGQQFQVTSFELQMPVDLGGIQKYLESGLIKGIGVTYANRIVKKFGIDTLKVIDQTPEALLQVEGIGEKRIDQIKKCWDDQKAIRELMIFLQANEIRPSFAQKIFKVYGENSIKKIKENPFGLAKEVFGIGFKSADVIATHLGVAKDSPTRIDAGIEHFLWEQSSEGHVCFPENELMKQTSAMLEIAEEAVTPRLLAMISEGRVVKHTLGTLEAPEDYVWVKPLFACEIGIVRELIRLQESNTVFRPFEVEKAVDWVQEQLSLRLAPLQKDAVIACLQDKMHIITGGPGTGKSTITKAILRISERLTGNILLAAPTGRAAKRMSEITHKKAFTIHSLLEFDFATRGFKRTRDNPLSCDLIIIDEASMIDTQLLYHLLKAIPPHARIILIGDIDQLPSVGPGNTLRDLIESSKISVTRLTEIFRQASGSKIILSAHNVNSGQFPILSEDPSSDFQFIAIDEPEMITQKILELVTKTLPKEGSFHPMESIQVLSPMKRGPIGIEQLNHVLQQALNPSNAPLVRMGRSFHNGDKVMQIKNNYDKKVYNGDIGRIVEMDLAEQELLVNFDGKDIPYEFSEIDELVLAYAVSVHKFQGSEYPCIIMPVHTSHYKLLYRNLLYTAITRGKKRVILIGTKKALAIAVKSAGVIKRYTGLKELLLRN